MGRRTWICASLAGAILATSCASPPGADPDSATVWGTVRLVPKRDMPSAGGGYGDRRLEGVSRFDYSHPRYAVVFAPDSPGGKNAPLELKIRAGRRGAVLDPAIGHASLDHGFTIRNTTDEDQVVSVPQSDWVVRIAAGDAATLERPSEGELNLYVLGESSSRGSALLWVSRGASAEVDASGRYVLEGLVPGSQTLRAWHPRLPPTKSFEIVVSPGEVLRHDVEIGVDEADLRGDQAP